MRAARAVGSFFSALRAPRRNGFGSGIVSPEPPRIGLALGGGFARGIAHRASADEAAILQAVQRPIALKCVQEKAPVPGWKTKPSWFLIAEQDRMIAPETQRFMAERMGAKIRAHDVDHSPMYTAPAVAIGLILEAARATLG